MSDPVINLADGNGGRRMRTLIDSVFRARLANPLLDMRADAARLQVAHGEIVMTTDGFTVQPLEFAGGDIGALAVHGTVNDIAVSGAIPHWLSLGVVIEEGLALRQLERIVDSIAAAARESDVRIVTGDTKVVPRGQGGGLYLTTCGIGTRIAGMRSDIAAIRVGDRILVSGPVGDHGAAVLLAREEFGLRGDLASDVASVLPLTRALAGVPTLRFLRDPTRGGLATVLHEISAATGHRIHIEEDRIPVRESVRVVCDMLGFEPLFLACEGRVVAVVGKEDCDTVLQRWRALPAGRAAAIIGAVGPGSPGLLLRTRQRGERWIDELEDDPLPRIC